MEKENINKYDKFIDKELAELFDKTKKSIDGEINIVDEKINKINKYLPKKIDLFLGHWDILLETGKNFLITSSTILITALALDEKVINLDITYLRLISIVGLFLSILSISYILYKRTKYVDEILEKMDALSKKTTDLTDLKYDVYKKFDKNNPESMTNIKNLIYEKIKEHSK